MPLSGKMQYFWFTHCMENRGCQYLHPKTSHSVLRMDAITEAHIDIIISVAMSFMSFNYSDKTSKVTFTLDLQETEDALSFHSL